MLLLPVVPVDVTGSALRLHLGATTWPSVASERFEQPDGIVLVFEVLAASHRVTLLDDRGGSGEPLIVETVACGDSGSAPVRSDELPRGHSHEVGSGHYRFGSSTVHGTTAVADTAEIVRSRTGSIQPGLAVAFPGHPDALTALVIDHAPNQDGIGWSTWHIYPGDNPHVVTTTSTFSLRNRRSHR